uniref:Ricin B-type lectin domain-containing protein n=1 Tax=Macrostomum lignano TaxID=282301 RepID=A0A1I8F1L1_9PLAT
MAKEEDRSKMKNEPPRIRAVQLAERGEEHKRRKLEQPEEGGEPEGKLVVDIDLEELERETEREEEAFREEMARFMEEVRQYEEGSQQEDGLEEEEEQQQPAEEPAEPQVDPEEQKRKFRRCRRGPQEVHTKDGWQKSASQGALHGLGREQRRATGSVRGAGVSQQTVDDVTPSSHLTSPASAAIECRVGDSLDADVEGGAQQASVHRIDLLFELQKSSRKTWMRKRANILMPPARLWLLAVTAVNLAALARCQAQTSDQVFRQADVLCAPRTITRPRSLASPSTRRLTAPSSPRRRPTLGVVLVAQFNKATLSPAPSSSTSPSVKILCRRRTTNDCVVFFRFPIDLGQLNPKLNNVWLGDPRDSIGEPGVCQAFEDANRLMPFDIEWSSEGAVFDGLSSHAVLNQSSLNFSAGATWLIRFKRLPQTQPILEFFPCNDSSMVSWKGIHMVEWDAPRKMYVRANRITGSPLPYLYSAIDQLSGDPNEWLNLGFTTVGGSYKFFVMNAFLPPNMIWPFDDNDFCSVQNGNLCLYLGKRFFKGTVRAVAFASGSLTEQEIREFFDLVQ